MSSESSSSRESSPAFHAGSPSSDVEGHTQRSWQPSAPAYNPSPSFQSSQPPSQPILRQPVGFGTNPPSVPTYQAPPPQSIPSTSQYLPGQNPPSEQPSSSSRKKSSKGKEKDSSKSSSRKSKTADKAASSHPAPTQPYPPPPPGSVHAVQKTAFRVQSYSNDPSPNGSAHATQDGPYGAAFRADLPDRPKAKSSKKKSKSTAPPAEAAQPPAQAPSQAPPQGYPPPSQYYPYQNAQQPPAAHQYPQPAAYHYPPQPHPSSHPHSHPQPGPSASDPQGRNSYYRYDYEKLRQTAPAYRAKMAASHAQSPGPGPPPAAPPPQNRYPTQHPPPNADQHSHSSRSSKHQDTHVYHTGYQYPPSPEYDQRDPSPPSPPAEYYDPNPPQPPPSYPQSQHQPYPPSYPPPPAHSPEKRHKSKSRSHRHDHHSSPAPPPPPPPSSTYEGAVHVPGVPPPAVRVCRVLTLLIEDKRHPDGESMLAEVRVPLKQLEGGEEGYWADAQEVTEELQKGPSRIDGAAKVYTQRGKYKQYFLRISADGDQVCQPANLMVSRTRTLDIFIEDNPPPAQKALDTNMHCSPPRLERELLTPMTESMASPSPAPVPPPPKRSSLFSVDDVQSPTEDKFDSMAYIASKALQSRKRPRSSSMQSVQSMTMPEEYTAQPPTDRTRSPSPEEKSSSGASSGMQSRTASQSSPASSSQSQELAPAPSASAPPADPPVSQKTQAPVSQSDASSQPKEASAFPTIPSTPSPFKASSAFMPGPSPPKKAKLSVPQATPHTAESVSPGPTQSVAYPWSHSRTPSFAESSAPSISGKSTKTGLSSTRMTSNPFAQYQSGFSLSSRQTDASRTMSAQSSGSISIPSLSTVSIAPSATIAAPATLVPSTTSALDNAVGAWIKSIISKEPQWETFVKNRSRVLKMSEQLEQYKYVQRVIDRFEKSMTPPDLEGAGSVEITKAQVMRAFNLPLSWGEDCTETLVMTTLYGPGGTRCEDPRVCAMLEETPPISTGMQARKYLTLLREVHGQWTIAHPDMP